MKYISEHLIKEKGDQPPDDWMSNCMSDKKKEGIDHEQAVAMCLSMWKQGGYDY